MNSIELIAETNLHSKAPSIYYFVGFEEIELQSPEIVLLWFIK